MKKLLLSFVVCCLVLALLPIAAFASDKTKVEQVPFTQETQKEATQNAVELVTSMYKAINNKNRDMTVASLLEKAKFKPVPKLMEYLSIRQEAMVKFRILDQVTDVKVDVKLSEADLRDDLLYLAISVYQAEYYEGSDIPGETGDVVWLILGAESDGTYRLLDFMSHDTPELVAFGNIRPSDYDPLRWQNRQCDKVIAKLKEYRDSKVVKFADEPKAYSSDYADCKSGEKGSINGNAVANYAKSYCSYANPPSGNSSQTSYYDFSQLSGNYDCTNFVSHSVLRGGAPMKNNGNPSTGWYYVNLNKRSHSWSGVNPFYNFIIANKGKGPHGYSKTYHVLEYPNFSGYGLGDIVQLRFDNGSLFDHSTVITDLYTYPGNMAKEPRISWRTSKSQYGKNKRLSVAYPNAKAKRVIVLTTYSNS